MKNADRKLLSGSSPGVGRRDLLRAGAAVLGGSLLAEWALLLEGCRRPESMADAGTSQGQADLSEPVRIGYLPITDATAVLVAHANGFFEAEGLKVEPPALIRSWAALGEAFAARKVNVCHLLWPMAIAMRFGQSLPLKIVAWHHINGSALTVGGESDIWELSDLRGKHIAIPYWYSVHNIILQQCLQRHGIQVVAQDRKAPLKDNQANLFPMPPPEMPTAVASKAIDGYIVAEPFNAAGELLAGARILRFTGDIFRDHPCCVAVMHEDKIKANRPWAQKIVNAIVRAELWAKEHPVETAVILSKEGRGYLPFPSKVITRATTFYDQTAYGALPPGQTARQARRAVAIKHPEWGTKRLGFQPYQFQSTTAFGVSLLKQTHVEGDSKFLQALDPVRVTAELMDYEMVTEAVDRLGGLAKFDGIDPVDPKRRTDVLDI